MSENDSSSTFVPPFVHTTMGCASSPPPPSPPSSMLTATTTTTTTTTTCETRTALPTTSTKQPRKPAPPPKIGLRLRAQLFEPDNPLLIPPPPATARPQQRPAASDNNGPWIKKPQQPPPVSVLPLPPPTPNRRHDNAASLSSPFSPMEESSQGSTPEDNRSISGGSARKPGAAGATRTSGLTCMFEAAVSAPSSPLLPLPTPQEEKSKQQRKKRPYIGGLYGRTTTTRGGYANDTFEASPQPFAAHHHHHRNGNSLWMGPGSSRPVRRTAPFNPFSPKPPPEAMEDDGTTLTDEGGGGGAASASMALPPSIFFPGFYGGQQPQGATATRQRRLLPQQPSLVVGTFPNKSFDSADGGDTQTTLSNTDDDDDTTLSPHQNPNPPPPTPLAQQQSPHLLLLNGGYPARHGRYSFTGSPIEEEEEDGDFGYGQSKMRRLAVHSDNDSPMTASTMEDFSNATTATSTTTEAHSSLDRRAKFAQSRRLLVDCPQVALNENDNVGGGTDSYRQLNISQDKSNNHDNDDCSPTDVAHFPPQQPPPRTPFKTKSALSRTPLKDNRNFASSSSWSLSPPSPHPAASEQAPRDKENMEPPGAPRIPRRSFGADQQYSYYRRPVYFFADGYGPNVASSEDDEDDDNDDHHEDDDSNDTSLFNIRRGRRHPVGGGGGGGAASVDEQLQLAPAGSPNVAMSMADHHHHHTTSAAPPLAPHHQPSRFATDFEIVGTLGAGSFGTVYKCLSKLDGCLYAVKAAKRAAKGIADRDRMLQEVYALAALCDQSDTAAAAFHIVRYHQAWMEDNRLYIQTELCSSTLHHQVRCGKMKDVNRRYKLLREMLLALQLLHKNDMVHLDIKPENIFWKNDQFKLGDFGLVNKRTSIDIEEGDSRYMSLELLSGDHSDWTKSDIFSLGATMYEICRGGDAALPMDGPEWQALRAEPVLLLQEKTLVETTPPELRQLIADMMHPDPSKRPTASQLLTRPQLLSDEQKLLRAEKAKVLQANRALALQGEILKRLTPPRKKLTRSNTWNGGSSVL